MRNIGIALVTGGLILGAGTIASAQEMAALTPGPEHKSEVVVFAEKGGHALSSTALQTVRAAASEAKMSKVTLIGAPTETATVKQALVSSGVPAQSIAQRYETRSPIAKASDGLADPADRRVEIKF